MILLKPNPDIYSNSGFSLFSNQNIITTLPVFKCFTTNGSIWAIWQDCIPMSFILNINSIQSRKLIMELTKLGPVVPQSATKVIFRITGETQIREYEPVLNYGNDPIGRMFANRCCVDFVNLRCRPFLRLDGYKPEDRSFVGHQIISSDVDFFYSDHPLVNIKSC